MLYDYSSKCRISAEFIMHETSNTKDWVKLNFNSFTIKLRNSWLCNLEPIIFLSKQFKHLNHSYSVDIHFDKISQIMLVTLTDSDEDVTKTFPICW